MTRALLEGEGRSAYMWNKPGDFGRRFAISVDPAAQEAVMAACRQLTGV